MKNSKKRYTYYEMSDIMERFVIRGAMTVPVNYGTGDAYNHVEVHTLSYIARNPGISLVEIAKDWDRTKGAVSQIVKKLEEHGLVTKEKRKENNNYICLFVTEKGAELDRIHKKFDSNFYKNHIIKYLQEKYTREEINCVFSVLEDIMELSKIRGNDDKVI